jgi:hypothetical protein
MVVLKVSCPVACRLARLRDLFFSRRLARAAAQLAGMPGAVRHYQNQAFFKEGADGPTLYHADNLACPIETHNQMITAWMPLAEITQVVA